MCNTNFRAGQSQLWVHGTLLVTLLVMMTLHTQLALLKAQSQLLIQEN